MLTTGKSLIVRDEHIRPAEREEVVVARVAANRFDRPNSEKCSPADEISNIGGFSGAEEGFLWGAANDISELADRRIGSVEDICKVGDKMTVKCIGVDDRGRIKLSRREAMRDLDAQKQG